jgi:predicted RNase H-like HicB family nuclease
MRLAKYEILKDGQYYGETPGFQGVWAQAGDLETYREDLQRNSETLHATSLQKIPTRRF